MTQVSDPNGNPLEFPGDMSMDQITEVMRKQFPPQSPNSALASSFQQRASQTGNPTDMAAALQAEKEATQPSFMPKTDRIDRGLGDPYRGIAQLGAHILPGVDAAGFDAKLAAGENDYQNRRKDAGLMGTDWYRKGGSLAGAAPLMMTPAGESLMGASLYGAGAGAVGGAVEPIYDTSKGFWGEKGMQVGAGAAVGAPIGGVAYGAGRMLSPNPSKEVNLLQDKGVTPTMGQLAGGVGKAIEDKLTSVPGLGDAIVVGQGRAIQQWNKAGFQTALDPLKAFDPGGKAPVFDGEAGRSGLAKVYQYISDAYDKVLPNVKFQADGQFTSDLQQASQSLGFAKPATQEHFQRLLTEQILPRVDANGTMTGESFKALESELTKNIGRWQQAGGDDAILAEGVDGVLNAFRGNLERSNPQYAEQLRAANAAYARYADLRRAVVNTKNADGVFSPEGLWAALKTGDKSPGKHVTGQAEGGDLQELALAGLKVLGNKYPDSGTAGRAAVATLLTAGPAAAGAIAAHPLMAAPVAGAALASTAYTLGPVQRLISNLFSRRTGQVAPLMGELLGAARPLGQAGASQAAPSLMGGQ